MANDVIIVDHIKVVANNVNTALQETDFGRPVYFMYGHHKEIQQRLTELTNSPAHADKKFPLIMLFTDITIDHNVPGFYGAVNLHFLICTYTVPTFTSEQRTEQTFKPVLHPIKRVLVEQLNNYPGFTTPEEVTYQETDLYFFGSQQNNKNVFGDALDAIELRNVRLNMYTEICDLTTNI